MNKLKTIFLLMAGALMVASCSDSPTLAEKIESGPNLAGFVANSKSVSKVADGSEYKIKVPIHIFGPSVRDLSGDIKVTIKAIQDSIPNALNPAKAGKHFRLDNNKIMLKASENYSGKFTFTMLTQGTAPLEAPPLLKLKVTSVSDSGNVVASGKPIEITLNYKMQ